MLRGSHTCIGNSRSSIRSRAMCSTAVCSRPLNVLFTRNLAPTSSPRESWDWHACFKHLLMLLLAVFSPQSFGQESVGPSFPSSPFCSFSQLQLHGYVLMANGSERCLFTPVVFSREMIISNFISLFLLCPSSRCLSRIVKSFLTTSFSISHWWVSSLLGINDFVLGYRTSGKTKTSSHVWCMVSRALQYTESVAIYSLMSLLTTLEGGQVKWSLKNLSSWINQSELS